MDESYHVKERVTYFGPLRGGGLHGETESWLLEGIIVLALREETTQRVHGQSKDVVIFGKVFGLAVLHKSSNVCSICRVQYHCESATRRSKYQIESKQVACFQS